MKIAVPSDDGKFIAQHFGRATGFSILEVQDHSVLNREYRKNDFTGHATGGHHGDHPHGHPQHAPDHAAHSHHRILGALHDCEVVISGGMGQRLFNDLTDNGKRIYITSQFEVDKAVALFLSNELISNRNKCSGHSSADH